MPTSTATVPRGRPAAAPPCRAMGSHCRGLKVTLRIGSFEDGVASLDHEATWLIGHTERITFGDLWDDEGDLYVDASLHVPCRYLVADGAGGASCRAHGYAGAMPRGPARPEQPRQLGGNRFRIVDRTRYRDLRLPTPPRMLPVLGTTTAMDRNPCEGAPCRTTDGKRGAACCRDLLLEIMCTERERKQEALLRARRAPYLGKVKRAGPWSIEAEMISACTFLAPGTVNCTLHGRVRPDGRAAKPDLCFEWPDDVPLADTLHVGCVFQKGRRKRKQELEARIRAGLATPPRAR